MAPLIAPGVARFTINAQYSNVPVANVLDIHIDGGGISADRADFCEDQAKIIVSAWADHVVPLLSNHYRANSVSWVDLNASTGTTGEVTEGTGTDFPATGGSSAGQLPGNVAVLVTKRIVANRESRSGRMFIPGALEAWTDQGNPNFLLNANREALETKLADFKGDVEQDGSNPIASYVSRIVVVHTKNNGTPEDPNVVYNGRSNVNTLAVEAKLHTQRRRMG